MGIQVIGNTSFLGHTGYANHSRNFFTHLNEYIPTRVRNYSGCEDLSYLKPEEYNLIIQQNLAGHIKPVGLPFTPNPNDTQINIILNESHHYYFYDQYDYPFIFYNVWESTKQLPEFFNRMLDADQFWCPTEIQKQWTIDQGYPASKIHVVPEAVNGALFYPGNTKVIRNQLFKKYDIPFDAFVFMIFGRWDYRKSTTEMIRAWKNAFGKVDNCYLVISVDNPFPTDGLKSTEDRLEYNGLEDDRIRVLHYPPREEYVKWLQYGHCLISCSRAEGWNLPLMEAIACGTPTIASNWGCHLDFANGFSHLVDVPKELPPKNVYMLGDNHDLGVWGEPDFDHLEYQMKYVWKKYADCKEIALRSSIYIRDKYTWDNAARIAEKNIRDLISERKTISISNDPNRKKVRLNLGCGNDIRDGYVNIDRYNNTEQVDHQWDIGDIKMPDNSVDEIFTSHVFEHVPINDVYRVLEEWERVLLPGGKLVIHVPNLEREVKIWLETPDDQKWMQVHRIFGSQSHEGNTHFNGHNPESLRSLIERFNFKVDSCVIGDSGYGEEIRLVGYKIPQIKVRTPSINCHFVDGPFCEVLGDSNDKAFYIFDFYDPINKSSVHQQMMGINTWTRPYRKYFTHWTVKVSRNGKRIYTHYFDPRGKNILVSMG